MGTPDFAVAPLSALFEAGEEIVGVFTKVDALSGRGMKPRFSPVKEYALEKGLPVYQPETFKDGACRELLETLAPDTIVVAAYGKILPPYVIDYPKYGCINIHGSLLPKYRGAAPIQRAVLGGDAETGLTVMKMDYGMDTGAILMTVKTAIGENETAGELFDRLAEMSRPLIVEAVQKLADGKLVPVPQDEDGATYAQKITAEEEEIDWTLPAAKVHDRIRGLSPFPGARTDLSGKRLKVYASKVVDFIAPESAVCGEVVVCKKGDLFVKCGTGCVALTSVKPEGGKLLTAQDLINGRKVAPGDILK